MYLPKRHLRLLLRMGKTAIPDQQHIGVMPMAWPGPLCQIPAIAAPVFDDLCEALPLHSQQQPLPRNEQTGKHTRSTLIESLTPQSMSSQFRQLLHPAAIIAAHGLPLSFPPRYACRVHKQAKHCMMLPSIALRPRLAPHLRASCNCR